MQFFEPSTEWGCSRTGPAAAVLIQGIQGTRCCLLRPSNVRSQMNSEHEGNRVCFPHGIATHRRAVLPSVPRYDTAEHPTQPIGLLPHL
jgi:hypothetical protein